MNVVADKYKYTRVKLRGPDGKAKYSAMSADAIARSMWGLDNKAVIKILQDNALDHVVKHAETKSTGHFRMIAGQALRAVINKGAGVMVNGLLIKSTGQDVPWPEGWTQEPIIRAGTPTPPGEMKFK